MLGAFLILKFCVAASEWVEISPISNGRNVSGAMRFTTPNYENIMITPFLKDNLIFTTPIYDLSPSNSELTMRPSIVTVNAKKNLTRRHDVDKNEKRPTTSYEDDEGFTKEDGNYEGFFAFLQRVQNNLMSYKTTSHKSKVSVLKHLRDNLLVNIRQRISKLWKPTVSKEARGYKDEEEEYHMEFPSNEGALMTIGFLTFAVFLIKLVIKLIQALKYKYEYYGTTTTTTTAANIIFLNRKKRDEVIENSAKIRQYIDEYPDTFIDDT